MCGPLAPRRAACPDDIRCSVTCGPIPALPQTTPNQGDFAVTWFESGVLCWWRGASAVVDCPDHDAATDADAVDDDSPCSDLRGAGSHSSRHPRPADGSLLSRGRRVRWRWCRCRRRLHAPTVDACPTVTPWLHAHVPLAALACATWCPASTACPPPATRCSARPSATAACSKSARTTLAAPAASRRQ